MKAFLIVLCAIASGCSLVTRNEDPRVLVPGTTRARIELHLGQPELVETFSGKKSLQEIRSAFLRAAGTRFFPLVHPEFSRDEYSSKLYEDYSRFKVSAQRTYLFSGSIAGRDPEATDGRYLIVVWYDARDTALAYAWEKRS